MLEVLGVTPAPNNGTLGRLHSILHSAPPLPDRPGADGSYEDCPYPEADDKEARRNASDCSCQQLSVRLSRVNFWRLFL